MSVAQALHVPVQAAGPVLDQWEVHVGAMNKLVVGAITLRQAKAFWSQTRVGAKQLIAAFHSAEAVPRRQHTSCPVRAFRRDATPALRPCLRWVEANRRALRTAHRAVSTWEMHVKDMEALRRGRLSPAAATSMWLSMWKRGVAELHRFHMAERTTRHVAAC